MKEESRIAQSIFFEGIVSIRPIIEAMTNKSFNDRKIETVFVSKNRAEEKIKELSWLKIRSKELGFEIQIVDEDFINENTTGHTHGGIIAKCSERTLPIIDENISLDGRFYVMIDGIEDPYNFGYAVRSTYAAGVDGIILSKRNWMSSAPIVARSSAGASEIIKMYVLDDVSAVDKLKKNGFKVVCADLRDSISIYDADLSLPLLLIVGGEKRGISRSVLDKSDINVKIEYGREFEQSLSAASAVTVAAFEVFRQNKNNIKKI